ncbi:MAG: hypothetical protein IKD37_06405 [Clostridia bacterium]|nr:hypothetical protein [Clostridia bacterium]
MDRPFTRRVMVRRTARLKATVLDIEIAGRRTLISLRPDFYPTRALLLADGGITVFDAALSVIPVAEV